MKAFFKAALLALALPVVAIANQFEEGVHYEVISDRATKKPEVTEFFSFYCPACNNMENVIYDIKPLLKDGVAFKKAHVNFMGGRSKENQEMLSQALATAEALPQKDQVIAGIFNHIHGERKSFNEVADVKDVFVAKGVEAAIFDKYYKSFGVRTKAKKMSKEQEFFKSKGALGSVPTFIVNGKYKVNFGRKSGISSAEDMANLINYLAQK
ncbi:MULTISPECIES: thiol:disulfide interchange protein DsbA/DsbL [Pseudoalteromonas]|uniref:thiol:disulfide interchange protein DsbA/DsbL n=1 Tax=Pseudoalteromonas TaxID=53246 RepID=UPI00026CD856|nr:thiol:disulfide interchange protein DsbA/DsbL [Pseudoalteromonas spongiae]ATC97535.1 thiol:disulfide interchange protein DsbA [Pseudoalteromonas spongiae UST010723-006]